MSLSICSVSKLQYVSSNTMLTCYNLSAVNLNCSMSVVNITLTSLMHWSWDFCIVFVMSCNMFRLMWAIINLLNIKQVEIPKDWMFGFMQNLQNNVCQILRCYMSQFK